MDASSPPRLGARKTVAGNAELPGATARDCGRGVQHHLRIVQLHAIAAALEPSSTPTSARSNSAGAQTCRRAARAQTYQRAQTYRRADIIAGGGETIGHIPHVVADAKNLLHHR